jgi:hypothetical protein
MQWCTLQDDKQDTTGQQETTMARKENTEGAATETSEAPKVEAPVAVPQSLAEMTQAGATVGGDSRSIAVTLADGTVMKRIDYIRRRWEAGVGRGTIAKELTQLTGQKVAYQAVFAATKGIPGGPKKDAGAADGAAA